MGVACLRCAQACVSGRHRSDLCAVRPPQARGGAHRVATQESPPSCVEKSHLEGMEKGPRGGLETLQALSPRPLPFQIQL